MPDSPIGCGARKHKTLARNEQTPTLSRFFQRDTLSSNTFRSFDYARGNEPIIYFTDLCKQ